MTVQYTAEILLRRFRAHLRSLGTQPFTVTISSIVQDMLQFYTQERESMARPLDWEHPRIVENLEEFVLTRECWFYHEDKHPSLEATFNLGVPRGRLDPAGDLELEIHYSWNSPVITFLDLQNVVSESGDFVLKPAMSIAKPISALSNVDIEYYVGPPGNWLRWDAESKLFHGKVPPTIATASGAGRLDAYTMPLDLTAIVTKQFPGNIAYQSTLRCALPITVKRRPDFCASSGGSVSLPSPLERLLATGPPRTCIPPPLPGSTDFEVHMAPKLKWRRESPVKQGKSPLKLPGMTAEDLFEAAEEAREGLSTAADPQNMFQKTMRHSGSRHRNPGYATDLYPRTAGSPYKPYSAYARHASTAALKLTTPRKTGDESAEQVDDAFDDAPKTSLRVQRSLKSPAVAGKPLGCQWSELEPTLFTEPACFTSFKAPQRQTGDSSDKENSVDDAPKTTLRVRRSQLSPSNLGSPRLLQRPSLKHTVFTPIKAPQRQAKLSTPICTSRSYRKSPYPHLKVVSDSESGSEPRIDSNEKRYELRELGATHVNRRGELDSDSEAGSPERSPQARDILLSPEKAEPDPSPSRRFVEQVPNWKMGIDLLPENMPDFLSDFEKKSSKRGRPSPPVALESKSKRIKSTQSECSPAQGEKPLSRDELEALETAAAVFDGEVFVKWKEEQQLQPHVVVRTHDPTADAASDTETADQRADSACNVEVAEQDGLEALHAMIDKLYLEADQGDREAFRQRLTCAASSVQPQASTKRPVPDDVALAQIEADMRRKAALLRGLDNSGHWTSACKNGSEKGDDTRSEASTSTYRSVSFPPPLVPRSGNTKPLAEQGLPSCDVKHPVSQQVGLQPASAATTSKPVEQKIDVEAWQREIRRNFKEDVLRKQRGSEDLGDVDVTMTDVGQEDQFTDDCSLDEVL